MRATVLIVDDSATFREYIRNGLEAAGYGVMTAESGEEGLSVAQNSEIDAFIVDNVLPGIDGASVVRRLRQQVRHRRTPSLLLTASDDPAQELNALEAGADAFVRKDETIEVLLARLAGVLRSVGAPAKAETERRAPTVLFVNSHGTPLEEAALTLSREGMDVRMALAAVLPGCDFDCIVANVGSVMEAGSLIRDVRARWRTRSPRLILLGQSEGRSELLDAIAFGADDYLPWSTGEAVLTARLRAQLRRKQLEDENENTRENLIRHRMELEAERQIAVARSAAAEELRVARDLAEEKAREAKDILMQTDAVFRSITEGLLISDLQGRFLQINDAAMKLFGATDRESLERLLHAGTQLCEMHTLASKVIPPDQWPLQIALRGESVSGAEMVFLRRDTGHSFVGSFNAVPVNNSEGRRILAALTVRDITAQKLSEDVLRRTEQLAVTGRLAASMAHEINNPLSAVMNLLYLLKRSVDHDPEALQHLTVAQKELQRVADITRQTLTFYRESLKPAEVDMCALAAEVEQLFSTKLRSAAVELHMELDCSTRPRAFGGELRQVLGNLISNAIEASPAGGIVRLRIRPGQRKSVPGVRISIADQGTGIPRRFYPEVFKPFASLKGERGTGLGLWVTQSIVARHDGSIRFHSSTERRSGTVFSVFIPLAPPLKSDRADTIGTLFRQLGEELLTRPSARPS